MDLPTPDMCGLAFHAALQDGDAQGVHAALLVMAVQDPARAQHLHDCLELALQVASTTFAGDTRPVGLRIIGMVSGRPCAFDGQWIVEYDPTRPGRDPDGHPMTAHIVCSPDPAQARRFATTDEAQAFWQTTSGRTRPDGQPDRPLTAFSVVTQPVETTP